MLAASWLASSTVANSLVAFMPDSVAVGCRGLICLCVAEINCAESVS
jgi:hypothetical protein